MSQLLAALAVLGLLLAPLARAAMASPVASAVDHAAMEMPADMPCCQEQGPAKSCATDCPLMATCMASLQALPPAARMLAAPNDGSTVRSGNDADPAGFSTGPPPRPPKT